MTLYTPWSSILLDWLALIFVWSSLPNVEGFEISKISLKTSDLPGSGMDQPSMSFFGFSDGGSFSVEICSFSGEDVSCCSTGVLDTQDDNWEPGQVDWFVGGQAGECEQFYLDTTAEVRLRLSHDGSDAGRVEWVMLHPWHNKQVYSCQIGVRLDYTSHYETHCRLFNSTPGSNDTNYLGFDCNGHQDFCWLRFDQVLFPGTHNSGTGQREGLARCASKNQDMDIIQQLEFGIRFFDLDVIYSKSLLGCSGLETGHGSHPSLGLYQCYGRMEDLLQGMARWLDNHRSEVVVLHFGNIALADQTVPRLKTAIRKVFSSESGVKINTRFKRTGHWPLLADAVHQNQRVFIFIRDEIDDITEEEYEFVREIKRKPHDELSADKSSSEVFMTSSYKAGGVGEDCRYILETSNTACISDMWRHTDFLKLSIFSRFGKGGTIGTECLYTMAKKCSYWVSQAISNCNFRPFRPNFLLVDFPNYQGLSQRNIVEEAFEVNRQRAALVHHGFGQQNND